VPALGAKGSSVEMLRSFRLGAVATALLVAAVGCAPARFVLVRDARSEPAIEIRQLRLRWSNVFLVRRGAAVILVDAGSPGDWPAFVDALRAVGVAPRQLRLAVLTHGHADHAGLAADLQRAGVPVVVGRGDAGMTTHGRNEPLRSTSALAAILRPLFDFAYPRFAPNVPLTVPMDLGVYGLPGVRIELMPGHTSGSLVVWIGAHDVIAGDVMLGGAWGDTYDPARASEHFYQDDVRVNHCNVERLLAAGAERFYVGHGGPIRRAAVLAWRRDWAREVPRCAPAGGSPFPPRPS
jgi:hydroxyacylglutathione hydrolase